MNSRCRICEWDSRFFSRRIARLEGSRLSPDELDSIVQWCVEQRIECLYFLADSRCPETLATAETAGFGFRDLRVTYEWKAGQRVDFRKKTTFEARPHLATDIDALAGIARKAHADSRFYFDRRFDRETVAGLYETWLRKACADHSQIVFTVDADGSPAGYLSCSLSSQTEGQIGLMAVDPRFQGKGIGSVMMEAALDWFSSQGIAQVSVVTQGRNVAAHRFYQRHRFLIHSTECWYHRWFEQCSLQPPHLSFPFV